jgi:hypothetical protein
MPKSFGECNHDYKTDDHIIPIPERTKNPDLAIGVFVG